MNDEGRGTAPAVAAEHGGAALGSVRCFVGRVLGRARPAMLLDLNYPWLAKPMAERGALAWPPGKNQAELSPWRSGLSCRRRRRAACEKKIRIRKPTPLHHLERPHSGPTSRRRVITSLDRFRNRSPCGGASEEPPSKAVVPLYSAGGHLVSPSRTRRNDLPLADEGAVAAVLWLGWQPLPQLGQSRRRRYACV